MTNELTGLAAVPPRLRNKRSQFSNELDWGVQEINTEAFLLSIIQNGVTVGCENLEIDSCKLAACHVLFWLRGHTNNDGLQKKKICSLNLNSSFMEVTHHRNHSRVMSR